MKKHPRWMQTLAAAIAAACLLFAVPPALARADSSGSAASAGDDGPLDSVTQLTYDQTVQVVQQAKREDPNGFRERRAGIFQSEAFTEVIRTTVDDPELAFDYFAATSTDQQVSALVANTAGKHFIIGGTEEAPVVQLVSGEPQSGSSQLSG